MTYDNDTDVSVTERNIGLILSAVIEQHNHDAKMMMM